MKRLFLLFFCVVILLSFGACTGGEKPSDDADTTNAVTSDTAKSDGTETADSISESEIGRKVSSETCFASFQNI